MPTPCQRSLNYHRRFQPPVHHHRCRFQSPVPEAAGSLAEAVRSAAVAALSASVAVDSAATAALRAHVAAGPAVAGTDSALEVAVSVAVAPLSVVAPAGTDEEKEDVASRLAGRSSFVVGGWWLW
jgi:hypothetical protein